VLVTGCSSSQINVPALAPGDLARLEQVANFPHRVYRIEPGDALQIRYTFHTEMNQDAIVQPDGKITVTHVGEMPVAGLTTTELERLLAERTSRRLKHPEVIVGIVKFSDKTVYIGGEVGRPGVVPYRKGLTPLQAIMAVGGFRDTARTDSVILIRTGSGDGEPMARTMNLGEVLAAGTREPLALAPHDVVFVPRTAIADANIWVRQHITDLIPFIRGLGATMPLVP
jgi:protein involved in polysaccharide export with SLBB domain